MTVETESSLWNRYRVSFHFLTNLCGSVPGNKEIVKTFVTNKMPSVKPAGGKDLEEIEQEILDTLVEEEIEMNTLIFQRVALNGAAEKSPALRAGTVRAHIKDCSTQLSTQFSGHIPAEGKRDEPDKDGEKKKSGKKGPTFRTRVLRGVYYDETKYWLPILLPEGAATEPSGTYDKPVHVRTPKGQEVSALKRIEYIAPPSELCITLKVLKGPGAVSRAELVQLFEYGGCHGYGGERSDGEGRYQATVELIES